jgi:FhuF 2Fe-2S C-terminal domain
VSTATSAPVEDTYARLARACGLTAIRTGERPTGEGWVSGAMLAADPVWMERVIDLEAGRIEAEYGRRPRRHVAAVWALHRYLQLAGVLLGGPLLLERRVPRLTAGDLTLHLPSRTAVVSATTFACLPGDALADSPEAEVVPGLDELRARLRAVAAEHFTPVLAAFAPPTRCGHRALWNAAADQLAGGLWHLGSTLGCEQRAVAEVAALLPGGTPPFHSPAGIRQVRLPDGACVFTRTRAHCCLYYTLRPGETCLSCPRIGESERLRRLAERASP